MVAAPVLVPDTLITTYLEMTNRHQFRPAYSSDTGVTVTKMEKADVSFYRFLYREVGHLWRWRDRNYLSDDELHAILESPNTAVYVLYVRGIPAGYVELCQSGNETEIAYFGLRPAYMGNGLGKHLLSYAIEQAWAKGTKRVWLHTCNLDSPHALDNYLKRGFHIYEVHSTDMPNRYIS